MERDDPPGVDDLPKFDAVFDFHRRVAAFTEMAQALMFAGARYQALYASTWWGAWMKHSTSHGTDALTDFRGFMDAGLEQANQALLELQNSAGFLDSQRELVESIARFRTRHREVAESMQHWSHTPTTRDVDDLADALHDLRRELRRLRRQVADAQALAGRAPAPQPVARSGDRSVEPAPDVSRFPTREVSHGSR